MPFLGLTIVLMILGGIAQNVVLSTFRKYAGMRPKRGLTGGQAARELLDYHGLDEVRIEEAKWGQLSDHYDPTERVLRLSPEVGPVSSIAAVGIAAHEAGHALQHAEAYSPLMMRTSLARTISMGSRLVPFIFWGGFIISLVGFRQLGVPLAVLGMVLSIGMAGLSLVTLPVEFDASRRAKKLLYEHRIVDRQEMEGVNAVLNAAAWTYVVSALGAVLRVLVRRR